MDGMERFAAVVFGLFIIGMTFMGVAETMAEKEVAVACYKAATVNPNIKCEQNE